MYLSRFGSLILPFVNNNLLVLPGAIHTGMIALSSGGFDAYGSDQAPLAPTQMPYQGRILAADQETAWTAFKAIRALKGKRDTLYRREPDGSTQWLTARLIDAVPAIVPRFPQALDVNLTFDIALPIWQGSVVIDVLNADIPANDDDLPTTGAESDGYPVTMTWENLGDADQPSLKLYFTAGTAAITALTLTSLTTGHILSWAGTLAAGKVLAIDTGARQVTNDGAAAYSTLTIPTNREEWFLLKAETANLITLSITTAGTGEKLEWLYYDAFQ